MAPLKLLVIGGLMACVGCSGGNLPSGGVDAADAHAGVDAGDTSPADIGPVDARSDAYCPMNCGSAPWVATRVDGLEANHDVVLYSTFDDGAALEAYIVHPHHKKVSAFLGTLRESRAVLDYQA